MIPLSIFFYEDLVIIQNIEAMSPFVDSVCMKPHRFTIGVFLWIYMLRRLCCMLPQ
jgi:hypothetical protein